ncbi:MAG: NUDIX hydrolase [Candidatus Cloacimonetes bacterium]|nr:NUDIX hydrolase [Candidatus Cloacimonadota bacterium]
MNKSKQNSYQDVNFCLRCGHKLEIKTDREGKYRPQCPACHWIYYKNPVPAVAIVLLNDLHELLLIKRRFEPKAGEWALPSGYMEVYLSPEENALEELIEETGLQGRIKYCIGWHYGSSPLYEKILNIGFRIEATGGTLMAGDDALEARFFPLEQLPPIAFASHREFIRKETDL